MEMESFKTSKHVHYSSKYQAGVYMGQVDIAGLSDHITASYLRCPLESLRNIRHYVEPWKATEAIKATRATHVWVIFFLTVNC
jgi:hypothetical protein